MSSEFSPELRQELMDDFYAECDELLEAVRHQLAQAETVGEEPVRVAALMEGLARSVHSLKGISAIAGLRPAEQLAHAMEDLLRARMDAGSAAAADKIDALLGASQRLEQIVAAHRLGKPPPASDDWRARLAELASGAVSAAEIPPDPVQTERPPDPVEAVRERGLAPWRAAFAPTAELDAKGVNVGSVRRRLGEFGEIVSATPKVHPNGSIEFSFIVGARKEPSDLEAWAADGVRLERLEAVEREATKPAVETSAAESIGPDALSLTPSHIVRVDLGRLDDLMRIAGELVIHRSRLDDRIGRIAGDVGALKEVNLSLARSLKELREAISRVRLVPIAEVFSRLPYVVRDLARGSDTKARVALEGHQTEVDKYVVERLKEPLLHLVRNAFSHGIEPAAKRLAAGKPEEGLITLRATSQGESVLVQVRDDGSGIDVPAVRARAEALGLALPARWDTAGLLDVLCRPGFSTRERADRASGRGVGMDVVANTVRELGGTLTLETVTGTGTQFTLRLPLTLSIADALIVVVGDQLCAVPQSAVKEIAQIAAGAARTIGSAEVVPYRGGVLPFVRLQSVFGQPVAQRDTLTILVVSSERGETGLAVDAVRAQREIVVRPLTDPLVRRPGISGATELGDGRPILILDPIALTRGAVRPVLEGDGPGAVHAGESFST